MLDKKKCRKEKQNKKKKKQRRKEILQLKEFILIYDPIC